MDWNIYAKVWIKFRASFFIFWRLCPVSIFNIHLPIFILWCVCVCLWEFFFFQFNVLFRLSVLITYAFYSESRTSLIKTSAVSELTNWNETRTYNYLVCKRTLIQPNWPNWPNWSFCRNGLVFVYQLSRCGFESRCSHLILFRILEIYLHYILSFTILWLFCDRFSHNVTCY